MFKFFRYDVSAYVHHSSLTLTLLLLLLTTCHTLDLTHDLAHTTEQLAEPKAPPLDPHAPNEKVYQRPVTTAKREEDAKVSPLVARLDVDGGQIVVSNRIRTVLASIRCVRVEQVARCLRDERLRVLATCLARRGVEDCSLGLLALHGDAVESSAEDAADPVGTGIDVVHPVAPEDGHFGVGPHDAVEQAEHDEEEGEHVADDGEGGGEGADPLAPGGDEEVEEHRHEEDVAGCGRVGGQAGGEVPQDPVKDGGEDRNGDFSDDLGLGDVSVFSR